MNFIYVQNTNRRALLSSFFGRAAEPPGYRAVSFWARASAPFHIRPATAPRKDTLRISLAQLAGLRFSALCSPNTPTSSGGKSGDHISTALILRLRAGSWAHRYVETLHCNGRSLVKKRWQSGALAPLIAFEFLNISN